MGSIELALLLPVATKISPDNKLSIKHIRIITYRKFINTFNMIYKTPIPHSSSIDSCYVDNIIPGQSHAFTCSLKSE